MFQGMEMNSFYDEIASEYDQLVQDDVNQNRFPYGAYEEMQYQVADYIFSNKHITKAQVLDVGIGTGSLYEKIMPEKLELTGIDNSEKMLEIARFRLPESRLVNHNILKGMPIDIKDDHFDYIVVDYLFKHFDVKTIVSLINQLVKKLAPFGKIFIGDIMFLDEGRKTAYLNANPDDLYPGYHYHSYSELITKLDDDLALSFLEINQYTGLMIIEKYYENPLHFEESLIKYKTNTVKWKSNQTQKSRE